MSLQEATTSLLGAVCHVRRPSRCFCRCNHAYCRRRNTVNAGFFTPDGFRWRQFVTAAFPRRFLSFVEALQSGDDAAFESSLREVASSCASVELAARKFQAIVEASTREQALYTTKQQQLVEDIEQARDTLHSA